MKKIFLLLLSVLAVSCSKNGPAFDLISSDMNLMDSGSSEIKMKREEPENGPIFNIKTSNPQDIKKLSKRIICGPMILEGRSGSGSEFLSFKISETEFPGLMTLPSHATCKLAVKLDGKLNGAREKELPIKFSFNANPVFPIIRYIARQSGSITFNADGEFLLERFTIKNTLKYAIGFTYSSAAYGCNVSGLFNINGGLVCAAQNFQMVSSKIKLKGLFESMTGDLSTWISFVVQPGDEVTVESFTKSSALLSSNYNSSDPFSAGALLVKISLRQCTDILTSQGLSMWGDFKQTKEDIAQPSKFILPAESIQNLPEWNAKGC